MIHGELVTLRAVRDTDIDVMLEWMNDLETELLGGGGAPNPRTREQMVELVESRQKEKSTTNFVIEADGLPIGDLGLFNVNQNARHCELGVTIGNKDYWGRGYGTEAVKLAVDFAFRIRNMRKVHLSTLANNPRAIRAYIKAGFVEEGRRVQHEWSNGEYVDLVEMAILRDA